MRGSMGRRRATGIRAAEPLASRQGMLRALAVASIVGVGTLTGFGAAGLGPLSALAGDAQESSTEAEPPSPAPSDGGGSPATGTPSPAQTSAETPAETPE
ncbi:MAG: hypothetical protein L0G52_01000, partial [Brachybacterium sp.]|nr:hypothetical protein [Brachybacterium sp.]